MGFFDRLRRSKKEKAGAGSIPQPPCPQEADTVGQLLFTRKTVTAEELTAAIDGRFGAGSVSGVSADRPGLVSFRVQAEGVEFWCSQIAMPMPAEVDDITPLLDGGFYTVEEQQGMAGHRSFLLVGQKGGGTDLAEKRRVCRIFTRLCGAVMELPGAVGFLNGKAGLLAGRQFFLHHAEILEREKDDPEYFPAPLWVALSQGENGGHRAIGTDGLRQFGFYELFFFDPREEWAQIYEKLYMMSILQITGRALYQDQELINFGEYEAVFKLLQDRLAVISDQ